MWRKYRARLYPEMKVLKDMLKLRGITYGIMAARLGIAEGTFYSKINGFHCFTLPEVAMMAEVLGMTPADAGRLMLVDYMGREAALK